MAIIRGGAATPTRYYKKKKKKPPAPAPAARPSGPGRVQSIAPFKRIAAKSQAGKSLTIKDVQYMQRLAWTTKKPETAELAHAIDTARSWIDGLKKQGGVSVSNASGTKVNIGAGGLQYQAFHEKNVIQPTKKYQSVLDSYAQNGGNDLLSSGPSPTAADQATPATAPPAPQASDLPVPPADGPVRDIALGQWQATGTIPGPQKMVDLLSAGLSMTDLDPSATNLGVPGADAWMKFMQTAHKFPSKVPPPSDDPIPVGGSAADLMFKQADFSKAPPEDGSIWNRVKQVASTSPYTAWKTLVDPDEYLGKTEVVYQGARDLDWFMGLDEAQKKEVQKALAERGYVPAKSGSIPTVSFVMPYVSVVNQFSYESNLAAAMFSKDPHEKGDASDVLKRTNVQGGGTELGQLAQTLNGSDDQAFLTTVYNASFRARPVGISESGFALWYAKKWGTDKLPQAEQAGAQGVSQGGVMESIFAEVKLPAEVVWHYVATSGKLGKVITDVLPVVAPLPFVGVVQVDKALNNDPILGPVKKTLQGGMKATFGKANEGVAWTIAEANRVLCANNIASILQQDPSWSPGEKLPKEEADRRLRLGAFSVNPVIGLGLEAGHAVAHPDWMVERVNGYASVLENMSKGWKMSPGRKIWYDTLSDIGVPWEDHEHIAFWGQMMTEGLITVPLQGGAAAVVSTALKSRPALAALKVLQVKSHAEILTAAKSPSQIKALYNVTDEAAIELAAITDPAEILLKLNGPDKFGAKYFDPDMHFSARSIAQNLRVKMMGDTKLAPTYRAFMSPLPEGVFDCVVDTDQQVLGALRYAGIDSKVAHEFADGIIAARAGAADFPEMAVRSYLTHPKTGFNALIEKSLKGKDASKAFVLDNGASTKLDELHSFLRRFRGKKAEVGPPATRVGYSLRPSETIAGRLEEGSLALPAELTAPVLATVRAARKVIEDIDKRLPGADAKTAASLAKKRTSAESSIDIAIHELNIMEPQVVGMPTAATEAQFARTFSPDYTPTELAIFSGGKNMQEWAILQKRLHLTDINSAVKRMWLSRMGTMITIIGSDEALRAILNGVNPLGGIKGLKKLPGFEGTMSADAAEAALRSPSTMADILDITDLKRATDWGEIGPDSADITTRNMGVHQSLKTFNAETSMPVKDWLEARDAAYIDLVADAERAKFAPAVKPPKAGDVVPGAGVDRQIADLEREASILIEDAPEARGPVNIEHPATDADLRAYIRALPGGGISRDNPYWSKPLGKSGDLTLRENRAAFGYLDVKEGGFPIDELADLIIRDAEFGFGIDDTGDLFNWLGRQGAKRASTTKTEVNARLYEIDAEIKRLRAEAPGSGENLMDAPDHLFDTSEQIGVGEQAGLDIAVDKTATKGRYEIPAQRPQEMPGQTAMSAPPSGAREVTGPIESFPEKNGIPQKDTVWYHGQAGYGAPVGDHIWWAKTYDEAARYARSAEQRHTGEPIRVFAAPHEYLRSGKFDAQPFGSHDAYLSTTTDALPRETQPVTDSVSLSSLDVPQAAPTPILSERDQIALHKTKAAAAADAQLGDLMRSDPRYIGGTTADGRKLTGLLPTRNPGAFDPLLLEQGLDNKPWIKSIQDEYNRRINTMMSHATTESHLRTGRIGPNDLKSATVQNIYGPVQYSIERIEAGRISRIPLTISDTILGTLGHMATHLKKQEFGNFFDERMATLKGFSEAQMPRLEKMEVSRKYAVAKTDELSYLNGRTLVEENMRNVVMFLPAYRQFLTWWGKRFATHPFGTHQLMKAISSIPPVSIPDSVPIIGGVDWDSGPMNFFAGLSGEGNKSWLPPLAPTITIPAEAAALSGQPDAFAFYKLLNGGFEPGGPQMRWLDSLIYGALGKTPYDMAKALHIPAPGSEQIDTSRKNRAVAEMIAQGVMGGADAIDAGAAVRAVRAQEAGKGGLQWALPGTWRGTKAKFTVNVPPQFGPNGEHIFPGRKMTLDMGRIAEAQWKYLSAVTPEARVKVIMDYPEYAPVETAWELYGEKQLEYLSKNRWVIGLVSPRNTPLPEGTIETPITPPGKPLSMEDVAKGMKERYDQVDKYVLAQAYQKQKKLWDKGFAEKYKGLKGQAKQDALDPKNAFADWYYKPRQAKWYADHNKKGELDRLLKVEGTPAGLREQTTVLNQAGEKHLFANPYLFPDLLGRTEESQLSDGDYEGMKRLEGSGLLWGKELVRGSRRYDQYLGKRKEEIAGIQRRFLTAALTPYKSRVHPDDWALFGKDWPEKTAPALGAKLLSFETEIEKRSAALRKNHTFATKEYKAEYYKLQDYIHTAKTKNPLLAPYIGASAPKLLGSGQLALDKPMFVDVKPKTMAEWEKMRVTLWKTPGVVTAKNVLKLKRSASPELQANWDEATRALCWDFTLRVAESGRKSLLASNNPYGWYKGWTIESKYGTAMQGWMKRNMHAFTNAKAPISKSFFRQWGEADKAAGGNLIYDLLDTSK